MQITGSIPFNQHPSMFQAILEQCSSKHIDFEQEYPDENSLHLLPQQIFNDQKVEDKQSAWFLMDQIPHQGFIQDNQNTEDDVNIEFRRVKSLREEQESKIAQFLKDDKYKSAKVQKVAKNQSPVGKSSQSVSPKKTKRIDKSKQLKLIQESD